MRKGIVLAGGFGTRLYPLTCVVSKQLLPVYDKPMVYYSLSVLMLAGIRDILVISTPRDLPSFQGLLGDGSQWGLGLQYATQEYPGGLAQAFLIAEKFLGGGLSALILGDNIFYGHGLSTVLRGAHDRAQGGSIFVHHVDDPQRYGILERDAHGQPLRIHEKPTHPSSHYAVTGLYFYDEQVCKHVKSLRPSARGELEITDLNNIYLEHNALSVEYLGRGYAWFDVGTCESLLEAQQFVHTVERRQGLKIACLEEIAFRSGWIDAEQVKRIAQPMLHTQYGKYLLGILQGLS